MAPVVLSQEHLFPQRKIIAFENALTIFARILLCCRKNGWGDKIVSVASKLKGGNLNQVRRASQLASHHQFARRACVAIAATCPWFVEQRNLWNNISLFAYKISSSSSFFYSSFSSSLINGQQEKLKSTLTSWWCRRASRATRPVLSQF